MFNKGKKRERGSGSYSNSNSTAQQSVEEENLEEILSEMEDNHTGHSKRRKVLPNTDDNSVLQPMEIDWDEGKSCKQPELVYQFVDSCGEPVRSITSEELTGESEAQAQAPTPTTPTTPNSDTSLSCQRNISSGLNHEIATGKRGARTKSRIIDNILADVKQQPTTTTVVTNIESTGEADEKDEEEGCTATPKRCCKFCLGNEDIQEGWVRPCRCKGTLEYVHHKCLNRWRQEGTRRACYFKCELCNSSYRFVKTSPPFLKYLKIFFQQPWEVIGVNMFVLPTLCACLILCMYSISWMLCKTILYIGPVLILQLFVSLIKMVEQWFSRNNRNIDNGAAAPPVPGIQANDRFMIRNNVLPALLKFLALFSLVLAGGYIGKLVVYACNHDMFYRKLGWGIDFGHFFVSSLFTSYVYFWIILYNNIRLFVRKHGSERVLDLDEECTVKETDVVSESKICWYLTYLEWDMD